MKCIIWFQVVERTKRIEIEEEELKRKKKALEASIMQPAEAEKYRYLKVPFTFNYEWWKFWKENSNLFFPFKVNIETFYFVDFV